MKSPKKILRPVRRLFKEYKIIRLVVIIVFIWLLGASILWICEGRSNIEFNSLPKSLWNIAVYLFSGLDSGVPQSTFGKVVVALILVLSLGIVGIFTATLASLMTEHLIPIGVRSGNRVFLNPKPADFDTFKEGDDLIVIAFDFPQKLF